MHLLFDLLSSSGLEKELIQCYCNRYRHNSTKEGQLKIKLGRENDRQNKLLTKTSNSTKTKDASADKASNA